jgi:CheY-like chemotaxis protein
VARILLIDDDEAGFCSFARTILQDHGHQVLSTGTAEEGLELLSKTDVLEEIKQDPDLKVIPVVILSSFDKDSDLLASYRRHANCCVKKPVDADEFIREVKGIEDFWLTIVKLPSAA